MRYCLVAVLLFISSPLFAEMVSTGTGFFVSRDGYGVTNAHVIEGCKEVAVYRGSSMVVGRLIAVDKKFDLAIFKLPDSNYPTSFFRGGKYIRSGSTIFAFGYPLSRLLSKEMKVTSGIVNSMTGIGGDKSTIQISAPVQPGNSGGPLLDHSGNVVGVVVARLDRDKVKELEGSRSENVNFSINTKYVLNFLRKHNVPYWSRFSAVKRETEEIAEDAQAFTVRLECSPDSDTQTSAASVQKADDLLTVAPLPNNGAIRTFVSLPTSARLKINTKGWNHHHYVRFVEPGTETVLVDIFIRAGMAIEVKVPIGTYQMHRVRGKTWYGYQDLFGSGGRDARKKEPLIFKTDAGWSFNWSKKDANQASTCAPKSQCFSLDINRGGYVKPQPELSQTTCKGMGGKWICVEDCDCS